MPNLVGTGLNQVPTNSMLGGLAYQDPDRVKIKKLHVDEVSQINSEIADSAVDVFLYDTSKDSDGGAWRKRTQHTSWYNETLGTSTRGTRKEFPAVAVIVAEAAKVTIYDGDDPNLPMWMVFNQPTTSGSANTQHIAVVNIPISSVIMLNGILCVGFSSSGGWGVSEIGFVSDSQRWIWTAGIYKQAANTIAERNVGSAYRGVNTTSSALQLTNAVVRDIAMTVLPNAPIDSATGIQVPTIAIGNDRGVAIVRDDGITITKKDGNSWRSDGGTYEIEFDKNYGGYWYSHGYYSEGHGSYPNHGLTVGYEADITQTSPFIMANGNYNAELHLSQGTQRSNLPGGYWSSGHIPDFWFVSSHFNSNGGKVSFTNQGKHFGTQYGVTLLDRQPTDLLSSSGPRNSLGCYITKDYNTGWMVSEVTGAFLSETVTEKDGVNYATNGVAGGSNRLTSLNYSSGDLSWQMVDNASSANGYVNINLTGLTVGQTYKITMTWDNNAVLDSGYHHRIAHQNGTANENATNFNHWNKNNGSSETLTGVFTAQSTGDDDLIIYANAITLNISNFKIEETDDINAHELVTNGTFETNYSGWAAGNSNTTLSVYTDMGGFKRLRIQGQNSGSSWPYAIQSFPTVVGAEYKFSIYFDHAGTDARMQIRNDNTNTASNAVMYEDIGSSSGNFISRSFVATSTRSYLFLYVKSVSGDGYFDNVSVRLASADRSVHYKSIAALGTLERTPVAPGAELLAYSGFSTTSHLRQSPNPTMQIGTGSAYMMVWYKTTNTSSHAMVMSYEGGAEGSTDYGKPFNLRLQSGQLSGWASHNNFSTYDTCVHNLATADDKWHCGAWVKRGQVFELYVDGELVGTATGNVLANSISDVNSELVLGGRKRGHNFGVSTDEPFTDGSLALARMGKSAPTREQIRKIYDDEKHLFKENAKCTLYGTGNAVRDIAYDEVTDRYHVGTASGRSDFQGLCRINNTTTAVVTAISAHDGFIVEQ